MQWQHVNIYTICQVIKSNVLGMNLNTTTQASSPILVHILKVQCNLSKNRYVVYYEIPTQPDQFRSIENLEEITIASKIVKFKILDLQSSSALPIMRSAQVTYKNQTHIQISLNAQQGTINISGTIINQTDSSGSMFAMSITDISGYATFLNFRRKYKTLQNVTRKQQFQLDHRLKITDSSNSTFWFTMQESDRTKYFFSQRKLTIYLEQIFKIDDYQTIQTIQQQILDLTDVDMCLNAVLSVLNKVKITLDIQLIKNSNFTKSEMASLRILQSSSEFKEIIIGTDQFQQMTAISPLEDGKFYDYEYTYLNKNLKQLEGTSIYEHINKLTPSFPKYPHFINSKIIHIGQSRQLVFNVQGKKLKLPLVYVLKGFNILQSQDYTIKFYIQFKDSTQNVQLKQQLADNRHFYQLSLTDIWNLGSVAKNNDYFQLKIITENVIYCIPFTRTQIDSANFKKQSKQLQMKQQYGQFNENKYYIITKSLKKDKIFLTKTDQINQFYLLDLSSSGSIFFQIISKKQTLLQGIVKRQKILQSADKHCLETVLSTPDNSQKVIVFAQLSEIQQNNQSLRLYYKIMQRLQFTDQTPCDNIRYSMEIKRLSDNKKLATKITPQMQSDGISSLVAMEDGFYCPTSPQLQLVLSVRKMFYDQQTQVFDNEQILNKKIIVNASAEKVLQKNCFLLNIQKQGYTSIDFDFYDENIKKRLKLHIQIILRNNSFFDASNGSYKIKIPSLLWNFNSWVGDSPQICIQTHLSRKKKQGSKQNIFTDSPQQYTLPFYNHKDGLSIKINQQVGYQKIMDAIKLKCEIVKNTLGWLDDSEWYLAIVNVGKNAFHFMIKYSYDPLAADQSDGGSVKSGKTLGKKGSQRSYGQKIDPFAKTVKNMDLFNLKKIRNNVVNQGRKLTGKYVHCQQTIISLTKKIQQVQQLNRKKIADEKQVMNFTNTSKLRVKPSNFKQMTKLTQFYRSICQCGAKNPKFNGYCQNCLIKMKKQYEIYFKQYKQKSYTYEKLCFEKFNNKQKLIRIKNKVQAYKQKLRTGQNIDEDNFNNVFKDIEQQQIRRQIENQKIELYRLNQKQIQLEDTGKKRQEALERLIKVQDDEILNGIQQLDMLNNQFQILQEKLDSIV